MPGNNLKQVLQRKTLLHNFHLKSLFGFTGLALMLASTQALAVDTDGDGVDDAVDNCTLVANGPLLPDAGGNSQLDTDGDGYGNICDADLDQDNIVGF